MDFSEFEATLTTGTADTPPALPSDLLRALWLDKVGDFDGAHAIAQDADGPDGARVHAYLHRKEGDLPNARYWYRRAGCAEESASLDGEWEALVRRLLPA
jgi:hypothetical protein